MQGIVETLADNPLILLFLVAAVGYPLGRIRIAGTRPGVASVLFAGLMIGAVDPRLKLPEVVYLLGLVLFIYPIGLASGPAFFAAFRRKGVRDNLFVAGVLAVAALVAVLLDRALGLGAPLTAGLFAGSLTNTPALAAVVETLQAAAPAGVAEAVRAQPVIGYSIAYPVGVVGVLAALALAQRIWKVDLAAEARALEHLGATNRELASRTIRITTPAATRQPLARTAAQEGWDVIFTRVAAGADVALLDSETTLQPGDRVIAVGTEAELDRVQEYLGVADDPTLALDRTRIDYRRIFVSSSAVAGRPLREVALPQRFGAIITRIRRGDIELLPNGSTVLQLGDRVRVVARREDLQRISEFFGDSYRRLSEVDVATFSLGLFFGLLLGLLPIPLPGGVTVRLGLAGGPLVAGLVLGARGFTGRLTWMLPYSANLTLRQVGLVLFLAGVGTQAGFAFVRTLASAQGLMLFGAGALLTCTTVLLALVVGYRVLRIPFSLLLGIIAAAHTQPAVLGYATEQTGNDLPNLAYATVYPTAIIAKIVIVQLLVTLL